MTATGLSALFEPLAQQRIAIEGAMQPIWALNWFLRSYCAGLPDEQRRRFASMTVAELAADPAVLSVDEIVSALSPATRTELANAHALYARKNESGD
jgi:ABC-type glutathione transport system ATPase component